MAFTGDYLEYSLLFVRNEQKIKVQSFLEGFTGVKARWQITFAEDAFGALEDEYITLINTNIVPIGNMLSVVFKSVPTAPNHVIIPYGIGSYTDFILYVDYIFVPHLLKQKEITDNYDINVVYQYEGTRNKSTVILTAKTPGPYYDISYLSTAPVESIENTGGTDAIYKAGDIVFNLKVFAEKLIYPEDGIGAESIIKAAELNAPADSNGNAYFNISEILKSFMAPWIYKGNFSRFYQYALPFLLKTKWVLAEKSDMPGYEADTIVASNYALLGGRPHPNEWGDGFKYATETGQDVYLLTNQPQGCRIHPLFIATYSYLAGYVLTNKRFGIIKRYINDHDLEVDEIILFPKFEDDYTGKISQTYIVMKHCANYSLPEGDPADIVREIEIVPNYNAKISYVFSLKLKIDHHPYRWNNFFFFFNALGGTDLAWLTGKLEISKDPEFIEYQNEFTAVPENDSTSRQRELKSAGQKFRIYSGLKTKAEILWLQELLDSEMIHWYTDKQYRQWYYIQSTDEVPDPMLQPQFQPIKILKESYNILDEIDNMQSFSFEFIIAAPDPVSLTKIHI